MGRILTVEPDGRLLPGAQGLSDEQAAALDLDRHVVVVAGAGSGKTRTLTRRYLRILGALAWRAVVSGEARAPGPEAILVSTFTERAAAEMRGRIRAELGEAVRELRDHGPALADSLRAVGHADPEAIVAGLTTHLAGARERFDRARIGTFHSFAASALREFAAQAQLDPGFTLVEGADEALLREQAIEASLSAAEAAGEPAALFDAFDRRALLDCLRTWVRRRHDLEPFAAYIGAPDADLLDQWQRAYADVELAALERELSPAGMIYRELEQFTELEHDLVDPTNPPRAIAASKQALVFMEEPRPAHPIDRADRLRAIVRLFRTRGGEGHIAKGHHSWTGRGSALRYPERRKEIEQTWNDLRPLLVDLFGEHAESLDTLLGAADRLGVSVLRALADLGAAACERYRAALTAHRGMDFAELEAGLLRLLLSSEAARERLRHRFRHILVDEFQDTNTTQWHVVRLLSGDPLPGSGLFLVGDPKQAIYRFRGGDVTVFERARAELRAAGGLELSFTWNFRSRPGLIGAFNDLFGWLMPAADDAEAADYEARFEPLQARRRTADSDPGRLDLMWLEQRDAEPVPDPEEVDPEAASDEDEEEPPPADSLNRRAEDVAERAAAKAADLPPELGNLPPAHQEAEIVARLIRDVLLPCSDVHDGQRVAVLLRRRTHLAVYARALREAGVPHVVARGRGFFGRQEVHDLANLLVALAHPDDGIALLGALRGPLLRLEDAFLLWLARCGRRLGASEPLLRGWGAALERRRLTGLERDDLEDRMGWGELPPAGAAALTEAADRFIRWRLLSQELPLSAFLRQIVTETAAVYGFAKADPTGQAMANVEKLLALALTYDSRGAEGAADFADFLRAQDTLAVDEGEAALDATAPVVVMTIHQSKGLEFPCVVLPDLLQPLRMASRDSLLLARLPSRVPRPPGAPDLWEPGISVPVVEDAARTHKEMLLRRLIARQDRWEDVAEAHRLLYVALTRARDRIVTLSQPLGAEASTRIANLGAPDAKSWSELLAMWLQGGAERSAVVTHRVDPAQDVVPDDALIADAAVRRALVVARGAAWDPRDDGPTAAALLGDPAALARQLAAIEPPPVGRTSPHALQRPSERAPAASRAAEAPPPEIPAAKAGLVRGLLVHSCLEDGLVRPSAWTRRRVRQSLAAEGLLSEASEEWLNATLSRHLRGYRRAAPPELSDDAAVVFRELAFRLPLPPVASPDGGRVWLDGVIDVVYRRADGAGWAVIDYKSDEGDPQALAAAYLPQILAYAWAASRVLPELRDRGQRISGELLFTASGRRLLLFEPLTADELDQALRRQLRAAGLDRPGPPPD